MPMTHPIVFVGAGPGDPELITVKGKNALETADRIVYAGSLVPEAVLVWARKDAEKINSAGMNLEEIVDSLVDGHLTGKKVVRLHTGDPSLYGAIQEQIDELTERDIPFHVIPGVTAAFAAAAAAGLEYTSPEIAQTLILTRMAGRTPVPEMESLRSLASHQTSMVIYLSASLIGEVVEVLRDSYGHDSNVILAYKVSQPGEKIIQTRLRDLAAIAHEQGIRKQAVIIVGKVLNMEKALAKSRLYDKAFTHEYRKGSDDRA
jgi:precorrin-4/cobalt-precorrin-4 C11-methyltransferase